MNEFLMTALATARTQIGVSEKPPGSNRGPEVNVYLRSVGLPPGNSWCAAFLYWCFQMAAEKFGRKNPLVRTGHCLTHWNGAPSAARITAKEARANPDLVRPGMIGIMLFDRHTGAGHTYIVAARNNLTLTTIEGNTNQGLSREGGSVYQLDRRKISDSTLVGFLDYSRV